MIIKGQLRMILAGFCLWGASWAGFELNQLSAGTSWDYGMIVKGSYRDEINPIADGQTLTRTGVFINQSGSFNERLSLSATIGGILFWSLPEKNNEFHTRIIFPGGALGEAKATYVFGDPDKPFAEIQAGFFPIKYNPDAKNLGEYLYRSGTYPSVLYSGGWSYVNSAAYMAQGIGFRMNTFGGKWVHDFTLTLERDVQPTNDFSAGYLSTFKTDFFEFGLGLQWAHLIPVNPDTVIAPEDAKNAYVKENTPHPNKGLPLSYHWDPTDTTGEWQTEVGRPHYRSDDTLIVDPSDPRYGTFDPIRNASYISEDENGIPGEHLEYYTFRGIKTMARASLDLGSLLGADDALGPGTFKVYGEVALLGLQDQPGLYNNKRERMPIMFGLNIPTGKLLDMFSIELEYFDSPYPNDIENLFLNEFPLPLPSEVEDYSVFDLDAPRYTNPAHPSYLPGARDSVTKAFDRDNFKWTVYARKEIRDGLSITAQAASDHLRHFLITAVHGAKPSDFPATRFTKEWYFILRLEMGI